MIFGYYFITEKDNQFRKRKERSHREREKEYIDTHRIPPTPETDAAPEERTIIKIKYAENVIVGKQSKIEINRASKNDKEAAFVSQGIQTDMRHNACSNQGRRLPSEKLVKPEQNGDVTHVDREASLHHVQEDSLALQGESLNLDSLLEDSS